MLLLRTVLAGLFALLVMLQTFSFPGQFASMAREDPDFAPLRWPATVIVIFWLLCAQVVIVATWRLLTLVRRDAIFSDAAFKWVDAILYAIGAGWVVLVGVFLVVGFNADDPGPIVVLMLLVTGVTAFGLVMLVMRALLRQATHLRSEMETVI
ncbi:hypothetical protein AMIS_60460 [Actinoplanes missouriensis 431]|uniref:DUF2975 domain-containing protein n=1 Tax=Actinoplanes missouriensis (strain ATCC 14538 / DSM 43046 / CBS 188.64 / JCM 3121 / NBRC 102363 / NCIMB 12654 / NRRL B-3342 / UNCC 431) TaxID=512565 RepID=I0HE29_ACTM4|nr:hypothetical protein AMIS_60460 [Actinoplanes missouriensis 431]